jgi:hypothetical protein
MQLKARTEINAKNDQNSEPKFLFWNSCKCYGCYVMFSPMWNFPPLVKGGEGGENILPSPHSLPEHAFFPPLPPLHQPAPRGMLRLGRSQGVVNIVCVCVCVCSNTRVHNASCMLANLRCDPSLCPLPWAPPPPTASFSCRASQV